MVSPINGPMTDFTFKHMHITHFNGPFEILMDPLENLTGRRILYMHLIAKLLYNVNFDSTFLVCTENNATFHDAHPKISLD